MLLPTTTPTLMPMLLVTTMMMSCLRAVSGPLPYQRRR